MTDFFQRVFCRHLLQLQKPAEQKNHKRNSRLQLIMQQKNAVFKKAKHYNALKLYIKKIVNYLSLIRPTFFSLH